MFAGFAGGLGAGWGVEKSSSRYWGVLGWVVVDRGERFAAHSISLEILSRFRVYDCASFLFLGPFAYYLEAVHTMQATSLISETLSCLFPRINLLRLLLHKRLEAFHPSPQLTNKSRHLHGLD